MVDMEELVVAYLAIRTERERLKAAYEADDKKLQEDLGKLEKVMLEGCAEVNADSIKTKNGTVMRSTKERFFCTDWDNFRKFELDNADYDFRERRIHQANFREFMAENQQDGLPPGVNVMRELAITVRKARDRD